MRNNTDTAAALAMYAAETITERSTDTTHQDVPTRMGAS